MTGRARRQQRKRARSRAHVLRLLDEFASDFHSSMTIDRGAFSRAFHVFERRVFPTNGKLFPTIGDMMHTSDRF